MEQDAWKKFEEGKSFDAYLTYGAHPLEEEEGYRFCVYAPRARKVELIGEFNDWKGQPMEYERGNWKTVSKEALPGMLYLLDGLIERTTKNAVFVKKGE